VWFLVFVFYKHYFRHQNFRAGDMCTTPVSGDAPHLLNEEIVLKTGPHTNLILLWLVRSATNQTWSATNLPNSFILM